MNALGKVSAASVLMVAGQVYASDPDRWEDCARHPEYDRLARFAWRLARGVVEEEDRLRGIEIKELMDKHTPKEKQLDAGGLYLVMRKELMDKHTPKEKQP